MSNTFNIFYSFSFTGDYVDLGK